MKKISAVILTKNEEAVLAECIASISFCNEIVVIDGGSDDKTVAIAKEKGAIVVTDMGDFAHMRNTGLEKSSGEWILYIDADERVDEVLKNAIVATVDENNTDIAAYKVQRKNFYLGKHEWPQIEHMERLFQKTKLKKWHGTLHESPEIIGAVGVLEGFLLHYTHRNLSYMLSKTIQWSDYEAKLRFNAGHPKVTWWRFPRVMIPVFFDYYVAQKGYSAGIMGLIESIYQSFSIFVTYAKLWELQKKHE